MLAQPVVERWLGSNPVFFSDTSLPCCLAPFFLQEGLGKASHCSLGWHGLNAWNYQAKSSNPVALKPGGAQSQAWKWGLTGAQGSRSPERNNPASPDLHPRGCVNASLWFSNHQTHHGTWLSPTSLRRSISLTHHSSQRCVLLSLFLPTLNLSFAWGNLCPPCQMERTHLGM